MTWQGPYRDGKVHVAEDRCSTCVFLPGNPMHLAPGRVKAMVQRSMATGSAITCHKTLAYGGHDLDGALCRGFWNAYRDQVQALQLADRLGIVKEVPVP